MSTHESSTICTHCGYQFELASGIRGEGAPGDGSISLCIRCAGIDIFTLTDGVLGLRAPTPEEMEALEADEQITKARWAILAARAVNGERK